MEQLLETSERIVRSVESHFIRSLYNTIDWNNRLIEIKGARGVGKTTLMLQKASELKEKAESPLYVSLDHAYFYKNNILNLADYFFKYGGKYLFIDEVHKYPEKEKGLDWSQEIKNIYDSYPGLHLVYSGSSILQIYQGTGDLSRRKASYHLPGLSFREYLEFNNLFKYPVIKPEDVFKNHTQVTLQITNSLKVLPHFRDYLKCGFYPFYNEAKDRFYDRINNIVNVIIETDIPSVSEINFETIAKLKKLFALLAASTPYTPNMKLLASQLSVTDHRTLLKYLNLLEKAELIQTLGAEATGDRILNKPDKIYLNNTNLMHAMMQGPVDRGTARESFLLNQMSSVFPVSYPKQADFLADSKYRIEVGGKNKKYKQIANIPDSWIAMDDLETGFGNKIPLWLFGFMY